MLDRSLQLGNEEKIRESIRHRIEHGEQIALLLDELREIEVPVRKKFNYVTTITVYSNSNLGHVCAKQEDLAKKYILLLHYFLQNGITANEIVKLLQSCGGFWRETAGHYLAEIKNSEIAQRYVQLLTKLIESGADVKEVGILLSSIGVRGATFGHLIAWDPNDGVTQQYIELLQALLKKGLPAQNIFFLLKITIHPELKGYTFGHLVAIEQNENTILQYIELLKSLRTHGITDVELSELQNLKRKDINATFGDTIFQKHSFEIFYQYINSGCLTKEEIKRYQSKKDLIIGYIFALKAENKETALQNALNKNHPLGQLIWPKPFLREASFSDYPLDKIYLELSRLRQKKVNDSHKANPCSNMETTDTFHTSPQIVRMGSGEVQFFPPKTEVASSYDQAVPSYPMDTELFPLPSAPLPDLTDCAAATQKDDKISNPGSAVSNYSDFHEFINTYETNLSPSNLTILETTDITNLEKQLPAVPKEEPSWGESRLRVFKSKTELDKNECQKQANNREERKEGKRITPPQLH